MRLLSIFMVLCVTSTGWAQRNSIIITQDNVFNAAFQYFDGGANKSTQYSYNIGGSIGYEYKFKNFFAGSSLSVYNQSNEFYVNREKYTDFGNINNYSYQLTLPTYCWNLYLGYSFKIKKNDLDVFLGPYLYTYGEASYKESQPPTRIQDGKVQELRIIPVFFSKTFHIYPGASIGFRYKYLLFNERASLSLGVTQPFNFRPRFGGSGLIFIFQDTYTVIEQTPYYSLMLNPIIISLGIAYNF